jgi:UV DNA damage endonuclease
MTIKRIGFACKWIDRADQVDGIKPNDDAKQYNTGTTTISWLKRQTRDVAEQKLWDLVKGNIESTRKLVERVGNLEPHLRMLRISSDILPAYTEPTWSYFYQQADVKAYLERYFKQVGDLARRQDVRLSMHPGQFTVLASENPGIVERSIAEFEYHADMARYMGYGQEFQDFKINVHISGKQGPEGIRRAYQKLSTEARNCITIENDEISWGIESSLELADTCALVLDIHHHNIYAGEYIEANDDRIKRIIDSWRGVRPVIHYSMSREDYLVNHSCDERPSYHTLIESGYKRGKLRAHSDFMWNHALNTWAYTHNEWADVMVESKGKNLASFKLAEFWKSLENHV